MKLFKALFLAASASVALSASAGVEFKTTTIVNGEFAADTQWYTMAIGQQGYLFTNTVTNNYMPLQDTESFGIDSQLWCVVGNETDGYRFYNKAAGTAMQLSAPVNPGSIGTTGANAYVILAEPSAANRTFTWDITKSNNLDGSGYYINVHGKSNQKINNRDNRLAFWTAGADNGSTVRFDYPAELPSTAEGNVWTISTDPLIQLRGAEGATATLVGNQMQLSAGTWEFIAPEGKMIGKSTVVLADGTTNKKITAGSIAPHTVEGPAVVSAISASVIDNTGVPVFIYTGTAPYNVTYRIPTILTVQTGEHKGRLIAINDYRYCGGDIGAGRIDLYMSYSDDNGATWSEPDHMYGADGEPVAKGNGSAQKSDGKGNIIEGFDCGFGDPASVCDRETGEIFVLACAGHKGFWAGRRGDPQPSARWWSYDAGKTWTKADDTQYKQIYALLDGTCANGYIDSQFIGSGRIVQSRHIKVGTHYRIYCVNSGYHAASGNVSNWVFYSDDLGKNWHILGGGMKPAVSDGGDEPKCEELPDGSILLAARGNGGNRNFNIFRYTDIENGEGDWGSHINTNMGTSAQERINACNGEIMIIPVKNKETGARHYMALQSYPYGPGRKEVSINWKSLENPADYDEPSDFAVWGGRYCVTKHESAYSTMTVTADNQIGFMYEEGTFTGGNSNSEIFVKLSVETITGNKYEYCPDDDLSVNRKAAADMLEQRIPATSETGFVGTIAGNPAALNSIIDEFKNSDTFNYEAIAKFNTAVKGMAVVPETGKIYTFNSVHMPAKYLAVASNGNLELVNNANSDNAKFMLAKSADDREDFLIYNLGTKKFIPATPAAQETEIPTVAHAYQAVPYTFISQSNGNSAIVCQLPGNTGRPAVHVSGAGKIVTWTSGEAKSQFFMKAIADTELTVDEADRRHVAFDATTPVELTAGTETTVATTTLPEWLSDKNVVYTSEDPDVATIDENGKISALNPGRTNITASYGAASASREVIVNEEMSSISEIEADRQSKGYYDLQGRRVAKPAHGLYITESGEKVRI